VPETKQKSLEESSFEDMWFNVENPQ